jgi:ABC-type Fe3+-hydroxamate transport system substrate-binding protein
MQEFAIRYKGFAALFAAVLLSACASNPPPAPEPVAAPDPRVPTIEQATGPAECARPINEYQRVIAADVGTGSLDANVFPRIATDLGPVRQACAAGQVAQANQQLQATKRKYGYR